MSNLPKLASSQNRADEVPNQLLAKEIAAAHDSVAVRELVDNLANRDKALQSDCIKVLYEIGALQPDLIADYVDDFVALLTSRNNRLVWGSMTALGAIASLKAADVGRYTERIIQVTDTGSVITQDWGIRVLAVVAAHDPAAEARIFPYLKTFLQNCRPKDVPRHAESVLVAVTAANRADILPILEKRVASLKAAQKKRPEKVIDKIKRL